MAEWHPRGTVVMILTWTVGLGLGFGGLIELFVDPSGAIVDIWLTAMAADRPNKRG